MRASWTLEEPKVNARQWSRKLYSFHYATPWICIGPLFCSDQETYHRFFSYSRKTVSRFARLFQ
jgi:hypothetical protein